MVENQEKNKYFLFCKLIDSEKIAVHMFVQKRFLQKLVYPKIYTAL